MSRAHGLDVHPKYQGVRVDDNLEEGFPEPAFAIQKAADGLLNWVRPFSGTYDYWKRQLDSIADNPLKGYYHWWRSEYPAISQANIYLEVWDEGIYDFGAEDVERWGNDFSAKMAYGVRDFWEHIRNVRPEAEPLLYCNEDVYKFLYRYLGTWLDSVRLWFAGGKFYNQLLKGPLPDDVNPTLPYEYKDPSTKEIAWKREQWTFWQFSADGNEAADEFDFGKDEKASIDVDVYNGTVEQLMLEFGKGIVDSVKKIGKYYLLRMMPRPV